MKQFQAESKRLMDLMIHSIYTNPEIFLRELISNASDATDKLYIKSLSDASLQFDRDRFIIELEVDSEARTLRIRDYGIGMTDAEMEENLGTIAHSGSLEFKKALSGEETAKEAANLIGQFGVGFYSAFMVAQKVTVLSRALGEETAHLWTSEGVDGYTLEAAEKGEVGTEITLYLRPDTEEENYSRFLEEYTLRDLVRRYSNYIRYPIRMEVTKSRRVEPEKEGDEPKWEEYREVETLNSMTPIWEKSKNDLTQEDYDAFYQQEHFGYDKPLAHIHLVADGTLSYRAILYIPGEPPFDFYTKEYEKGLALYAKGVKIMDRCSELVPEYYRFVKGVVSSEDLSLNISREMLQQDRQLTAIARKIEGKITDELKKMLADDRTTYEKFFAAFGNQLKAGIYTTYGAKKDPLANLLLFHTSKGAELRTLREVVDGYGASKKAIYYATGDRVEQIDRSPALVGLKERGIEVLYLTDEIDEFVLKAMRDYEELPFVSVLDAEFSLADAEKESDAKESNAEKPEEADAEKKQPEDADQKALFDKMKTLLGEEVVAVTASRRLVDDAVLLVSKGEVSIEMEKTFAHQPGGAALRAQKVLELNTAHPLYQKLQSLFRADDEEGLKTYTELLYDQARLMAGLPIADAVTFAKRVQKLM